MRAGGDCVAMMSAAPPQKVLPRAHRRGAALSSDRSPANATILPRKKVIVVTWRVWATTRGGCFETADMCNGMRYYL